MTEDGKRKALVLFGLVLLATALIAAGLSQLDLKPGIPPPPNEGGAFVFMPQEADPPVRLQINTFIFTVIGMILAVLMAVMFIRALRGVSWKDLIKSFFSYLLTAAIVFGLLALIAYLLPAASVPSLPPQPEITPPPVETAPLGAPPSVLLWVVGILLAISVAAVGVWFVTSKPEGEREGDIFLWEAEKARRDLLSGLDLKDVILRCYQQMSELLQTERGIEREVYMTTGEFERLLEEKGYPAGPVCQLTRLFEAVRYGRRLPGKQDEENALASLDAIIRFSREGGGSQ